MGLRVYPPRRKKPGEFSFDLAPERAETEEIVEAEGGGNVFLDARAGGDIRAFDLETYLPRLGQQETTPAATETKEASAETKGVSAETVAYEEKYGALPDFADLNEYTEWKESQRPPDAPARDVYVWPGPSGWKGPRSKRAQEYHERVERAGEPSYQPTGKLYSWYDEAGTLQVTGNAEEIPENVDVRVFQGPTRRGVAQPAAAPVEEPPTGLPTVPVRERVAAITPGPSGEKMLAQVEKEVPVIDAVTSPARAVTPEDQKRREAVRKNEEKAVSDWRIAAAGMGGTRMIADMPGRPKAKSAVLGTTIQPARTPDLETTLSQLPRTSFVETMQDAYARREAKEPGFWSNLAAKADMFADVYSMGGTQQIELDYARKLVMADPEVQALAQKQGADLQALVFPDQQDFDLWYAWLTNKHRGGMPFTRRTRYGALQEFWREQAKSQPELVNLIAQKTLGAINSGVAMEHFQEQGILKGVYEGLITDPLFVGSLIIGGVTSGMKLGATGLAATGRVGAAAKVARAAKAVETARITVEPVEMAVGATAKGVAKGVSAVAKPAARRAAAKVLPEAEYGIRRALWTWAGEKPESVARRGIARAFSILDDADTVYAHKNRVVQSIREGLRKAGVPDEELVREGQRIERGATLVQKMQKKKPYLYRKGLRDAEELLKRVKGKTLVDPKTKQLTPLGRVVHYLDTGKGLDKLSDTEKEVAQTIRGILDELKEKLPEDVGKVEHYFPRFEPVPRKRRPVQEAKKALGKEAKKFWEEVREANRPAIRIYKTRDDALSGLGRRLAGQDVTELNEQINTTLIKLAESFGAAEKKIKKPAGFKVSAQVEISGKPHTIEEAQKIARIQRARGTDASIAAAERIEARVAEAEAKAGKIISAQQKALAKRKVKELPAEVQQVQKELAAAEEQVRGLEVPVRRAEKMKVRMEALREEAKELRQGFMDLAGSTEKEERMRQFRGVQQKIEKTQAELKALEPQPDEVKRLARTLYRDAKKRQRQEGGTLLQAVRREFTTGGIKIKKPTRPGAELDAWKRLAPAWKSTRQGLRLDDLIETVLEQNPQLRSKYGKIPDPMHVVEDLKAEARGGAKIRVVDFEEEAYQKLLFESQGYEEELARKLYDYELERERLVYEAMQNQVDDTLEEAERTRWGDAIQAKIEKLDQEFCELEEALGPEDALKQMARRLDRSYRNRTKLERHLKAKREKLDRYRDFTKAKPVYKEEPIDLSKDFVDFVRNYPVEQTELDILEKWHQKFLLRPFKTTMLGYRPSYALRNISTASLRTMNEMLNGILEGKPWAPSWSKAARDFMHMDKEFLFESMYARHIPVTTRKTMGRIPHFVYGLEGSADRYFKTGATIGKVRAHVTDLARLNEVATHGRPLSEIVGELRNKGIITDFADLVHKYGRQEANRIFFNFQERIGLMIGAPGQMFPFAEWGYKNWNYVVKDLVKHPWKLRAWKVAYDQWAHQYQDHPDYQRHVVRLTRDGPLRYFNNFFSQPLWNVGGYQPLMPFLEGTSEYDQLRIETFEPELQAILRRAQQEGLTWDEREKLIDRADTRMGFKGAGSFRHYLEDSYIAGAQTGYRYSKHALKELVDYMGQNLSLGPTAQLAVASIGLAKFPEYRNYFGWQNVLEDMGLIVDKRFLDFFIPEGKERYYERKIHQEMEKQELRGEIPNRKRAERAVGIERAIAHIVNNFLPLSGRFITPEDVERISMIETRRRAMAGLSPTPETSMIDVMKNQLETGRDYSIAKFHVEAERAQNKGDYARVVERRSPGGAVVALGPARLSTRSEEIEALKLAAALAVLEAVPEAEQKKYAQAYDVDGLVLADSGAIARKNVAAGYYEKTAAFLLADAKDRNKMVKDDQDLQMFELGVKEVGGVRARPHYAKQWIQRLADDSIAMGDPRVFRDKLAEHPEMIELVRDLPDGQTFINTIQAKVLKGAQTAPANVAADIKRINELRYQGQTEQLTSYLDKLSNERVGAIKDHIGEGEYKRMVDEAKDIGAFNEASELLQGVMQADDYVRAWEDLNTKDKGKIESHFPEWDIPERMKAEKKRREEHAENEEWKQRIAESNYDVRLRKTVPAEVKRRLANENQFWFDFFYPSAQMLAQAELRKEKLKEQKKREKEQAERKEFLAEVKKWEEQILASDFDSSFKGSRVPIDVRRHLADKDKRFEQFFFGKATGTGGKIAGGRRKKGRGSAHAGFGVTSGRLRGKGQRERKQLAFTARGQGKSSVFAQAAEAAGKKQ